MARRKTRTPAADTSVPARTEGLIFVGDGRFLIQGVPARDLTPEETARYRDLIEATQENTGRVLYVLESTEPTTPENGESDPDSGNEGE